MSLDAGPRLQAVLAELRRVPDILGATIARRDGILIASALAKSMDPRKIAAMAAAIVGTSEMAATEMGLGVFNQSIVDTHIGKLLATGAGEEAILITMVRNDAKYAASVTATTWSSRIVASGTARSQSCHSFRFMSATTRNRFSAVLPMNSMALRSILSHRVASSKLRNTEATAIAPI